MPLVRVEVRNEYGLGMPELYTETNREDPKAVLDGVAVAGLVGILRQLGDLAEFAAEVFHGLQEQVLITSSRSHKLIGRVHNIEAALPPLEKAILAQRSHLHFAYTAGSHWHTRLRTEQNHFIYSDLPRCIMDSYEDCRDPPRLHKLDKFDIGGPGSCFKRYSDPNYFKRSSAGPYEAHLQSVPREKKARRNKKKKYSSKYRDVTHDAPINMHVGRTDFGSSNFQERISPSQDNPIFHVPQKSGIEPENADHLTSFDSRNGTGYIECIFRPSYSTQSEDNNAKDQQSSDSNPQHNSINSYLDSASVDENNGIQDENMNDSYFAEHSNSKSSYITWDEKLEIIDSSASQPNDTTTQISCETEKKNTQEEKEDLNSEIVNHTDFTFHKEQPLVTSVVSGAQPDEIESETDYYMDALNTIESESETDIDIQTKRELMKHSKVKNDDHAEETREEADRVDDENSTNFEFHVPEVSSSDRVESSDLATLPQVAGVSSKDNITPEEVEPEEVERNETISETFKEPNSQSVTTPESPKVNQPVMFWTNGGLLGLQPSKPPDFGLAAPVEETKVNTTQDSSQKNTVNEDEQVTKEEETEENINSSRIFEFSNRLLVNGLRKQISLVGNERLANSVKTEVPENTNRTVTGIPFREQFGNITSFISPSSPPLEHMRISFQPIDGFETTKLKLTFPDGNSNIYNNNNNNESSRHMFPSFQLVPETETSLHESASDSDDDTFCRSSPYASDDNRSQRSESNSDQWDSGDSPRIKDHKLDDAFGRISSAESVSSSLVNGIRFQQGFPEPVKYASQSSLTENNGVQVQGSRNGVLFDIPSFDSLNVSSHKEPTPPPPPLPPMEWRGMKPHPHADVAMEKEDGLSEALSFALNLTPREPPIVPQPPKLAPKKQDHVVETVDLMIKRKQPEWQNLHVQNESNRTTNGKMGDEKEDFLQQIRTKSQNLRRTSTARPTITTPTGPTAVKVTAILEKANAIRQAVGSDEGEDDNWSDT